MKITKTILFVLCAALTICAVSCKTGNAPTHRVNNREAAAPEIIPVATETTNSPATKPIGKHYYTCAMHPEVHSQDPDGKCPICQMPLMPAEEVPDQTTNQ